MKIIVKYCFVNKVTTLVIGEGEAGGVRQIIYFIYIIFLYIVFYDYRYIYVYIIIEFWGLEGTLKII